MKAMLFVLSLNALIILSSCKSEEKIETTPKQGDTFVLPPQK